MLAIRGRGRDGDVDGPERLVYSLLGRFSYAPFPLLLAGIALPFHE